LESLLLHWNLIISRIEIEKGKNGGTSKRMEEVVHPWDRIVVRSFRRGNL
jgi:hypothetical protein